MGSRRRKSMVCFGLFKGTDLRSFSCGGEVGIIPWDDPRVAEYIPVTTGMYRVYFKS